MTRALIVIDIQNDYFPGGILPLHAAEATEARILAAMAHAQAAGDRVILVQHVAPAGSGLFAADGPGVGLRPAITAAAPQAPVVVKTLADSFQDTTLDQHLHGIDSLLICGMMTQNCVLMTALSESAHARPATVVGDLCTAPLEVVHLIALSAIRSKVSVAKAADLW